MDESVAQDEHLFAQKAVRGMFDGPILTLMIKLALPIFAGMFFQLLYTIVDTLWISRIDPGDPSYVGGTGLIFPLIFLVIAIGSGIVIGTSSLVARSIGEKNRRVLDKTAESGLIVGIGFAALLIVFGYLFDEEILRLLGARGDYYAHAMEYFHYMLPAGFLMLAGNVLNGILQGEGLMKKLMAAMIIGTLTNVVLDPVFIFILGMKVKGAGLATVVAQVVAGVYVVGVFVRKKTLVPINWKLSNIDLKVTRRIIAVGFPQTIGMVTMAVSFLVFNRIVVGLDPKAMAAFTICGRFDQMMIMPILSISSALITMVGQNYGRRNIERVKNIWKTCVLSTAVLVEALAALLFILAPAIYRFFTDVDAVLRYAVMQTRVIVFTYLFVAVVITGRGFFQAIGRPIPGFVVDTLRLAVVAIPMVYFYVYVAGLGIRGVWYGIVTGNVIAAAISLFWVRKSLSRLIARSVAL